MKLVTLISQSEKELLSCIAKLRVKESYLIVDKGVTVEIPIKDLELLKVKIIRIDNNTGRGNIKDKYGHEEQHLFSFIRVLTTIIDSTEGHIILNINATTLDKTLAAMYAVQLRPKRFLQIVYLNDQNEMIYLPSLPLKVSKSKREILHLLDKQYLVKDITTKMSLSPAMIYKHLRDMKKDGLIHEDKSLTLGGKLCLI